MALDWTIKATDIAIMLATCLGPVLAVQTQKFLERRRDARDRQERNFRVLATTRANMLSTEHVSALNAVPIEFPITERGAKAIHVAWKAYLDHMAKQTSSLEPWVLRAQELHLDLILEISNFLGYKFTKTELKSEVYAPKAHGDIQTDQLVILRGLSEVLQGKRSLPLEINSLPSDPGAIDLMKQTNKAILSWLSGNSPASVKVERPPEGRTRKGGRGTA
ncbi:MAG: DUF6680 family protein [Bauldia sp.]